MRIGFETTPITRTRTGVGQYCYHLLRHLLQLDHENEYRGLSSGMEEADLADLALSAHRRIAVPTRLLYRTWDVLRRPRVDSALGGVDLFHATNFVLPPTASAPRVLTIHDITFLSVPELCSPKIARYFARHIHRYAADADAILVHSESTRRDLVRHVSVPEDKVVVAPPGVEWVASEPEPERARALLRERYQIERPFVLYVGTLEPRKNVVGALRAFAQSKEAAGHLFILIGKRGWNCEPIFETIETLDLQARVRHLGYLEDQDDLRHFYAAAAAMLFPTYYEGFGLPVLEAMACGCPVATSNTSSVPEVAGDAALMAAPSDVDAHTENLDRLLANASLAATLRERGRARARQFTWTRCAELTLETYKKVAA